MKRNKKLLALMFFLILLGLVLFFYQIEASPRLQSSSFEPLTFDRGDYKITVTGPVDEIDSNYFIARGDIDQQQTTVEVGYIIGPCTNTRGWYAQEVHNDRTGCDGFSVIVGYHGNPTNPLYFGIMYPLQDPRYIPNNYLKVTYVDMDVMQYYNPDTLYWVFVDNSYTPYSGTDLYVVLISEQMPTESNYWLTGAASGTSYSRGICKAWCFQEESWCSYIEHDLAFKTYTPAGGGGSGDPTISVVFTGWIVTQVTGIFSFIGAGAVGTKYMGWI